MEWTLSIDSIQILEFCKGKYTEIPRLLFLFKQGKVVQHVLKNILVGFKNIVRIIQGLIIDSGDDRLHGTRLHREDSLKIRSDNTDL